MTKRITDLDRRVDARRKSTTGGKTCHRLRATILTGSALAARPMMVTLAW